MSEFRNTIRPRLNKETIEAHNEALSAELDEKLGIEPSELSAPTRPMVFASREKAPQVVSNNTLSTAVPMNDGLSTAMQNQFNNGEGSRIPLDVQREIEDGKKAMGIVVKGIKENEAVQNTDVIEKEPTPEGFPQAEHRSKRPMSRFRAARMAQKQQESFKENATHPVSNKVDNQIFDKNAETRTTESHNDPEMEAISKENQAIIDSMSPEQIRREQDELRNQLDPATIAFLINRKRNNNAKTGNSTASHSALKDDSVPNSGEQTPKHTRFSQTKPEVYTYPAEPHEKRTPIAYLPPPGHNVENGNAANHSSKTTTSHDDDKDGPEYIRKHYFPQEKPSTGIDASHDPLAWLRDQQEEQQDARSSSSNQIAIPHFDIQGNFVERKVPSYTKHGHHANDPSSSSSSSSHIHHHHAGDQIYTIPSVLALSSSSVMGQRVSAFSIIQKIIQKNLFSSNNNDDGNIADDNDNQEFLTNQDLDGILSRASQAIDDRGLAVAGTAVSVLATLLCTDEWVTGKDEKTTQRANILRRYCFQQIFQYKPITPFFRFQRHLENGTLPRSSLSMICSIILSLVRTPSTNSPVEGQFDPIDFIVDSQRGLLETIVARFIAVVWPPSSSSSLFTEEWSELGQGLPSTVAADIILEIATQSQGGALELMSRQLIDPFARYLAITPWSLYDKNENENEKDEKDEQKLQQLHYSMLCKLFDILAQLSKYKVGDEICMSWASLFGDVNHHFEHLTSETVNQQDLNLVKHWNKFLDAFENNFKPNPMSFPRRNFS